MFETATGIAILVTLAAGGTALVLMIHKNKLHPPPERLPPGELCEAQFQGPEREIAARLRKVLEQATGTDLSWLPPEGQLRRDVGLTSYWDSLQMVEAMMSIDQEFGIEFTDAELERMNTFRDAVAIIASQAC